MNVVHYQTNQIWGFMWCYFNMDVERKSQKIQIEIYSVVLAKVKQMYLRDHETKLNMLLPQFRTAS